LPVRVKALRMQCFFLSAYMCAIVTVQKYLDGGQYAGGILPGNIQIDQLDISATGLGGQYANGILRETSSNEYRTCFAVRSCQLEWKESFRYEMAIFVYSYRSGAVACRPSSSQALRKTFSASLLRPNHHARWFRLFRRRRSRSSTRRK